MKIPSSLTIRAAVFALCLGPVLTSLAQREVYKAPTGKFRTRGGIVTDLSKESGEKEDRKGKTLSGKIVELFVVKGAESNFDNVLFKFDSTDFQNRESADQVREIAAALKDSELAGASFLIEGHTCDIGSDAYNETLSVARAEQVRKVLVKAGVPQSRLIAIGYGEKDPAVQVKTSDDKVSAENKRKHNRRVMVRRVAR